MPRYLSEVLCIVFWSMISKRVVEEPFQGLKLPGWEAAGHCHLKEKE
jgi:hypothetical protein